MSSRKVWWSGTWVDIGGSGGSDVTPLDDDYPGQVNVDIGDILTWDGMEWVYTTAAIRVLLDASSIGVGNGNPIPQWDDESGNNFHFVQGTGANQPTLVTNAVNGLPAVNFDGINDWMSVSGVSISPITGEWTTFIVVKFDVLSGVKLLLNGDDSASPRGAQNARVNGTTYQTTLITPSATDSAPTTLATATWYILESVRGPTSVEALVNGVSNGATSVASPSEPADGLDLGAFNGSLFLDGQIAEVRCYEEALTTTKRTAIRQGLADKYSITI